MRQIEVKSLELKIPPPLVALAFIGAMYGVARVLPRLSFPVPGRTAIAVSLVALGVALAIAGVAAFREHRTTVNPLDPNASSTVVTSGVYRFTRNPMYLGMLLLLVGWAVYLGNAAAALLLIGFVAYITQFQIKPEERILLAKFGPEFGRYMSSVRRWI